MPIQGVDISLGQTDAELVHLLGIRQMSFLLQPWQLIIAVLSEWVRQQQEQVIEYLQTENQILREKHGTKRVLLNDDQRRRIAVKGKVLGRKSLHEFATVAQADTILRWHRQLVLQNGYTGPRGKFIGRPRTDQVIVDLVLQIAQENVSWGYKRIQGALDNLGYQVCSSTVANILKEHGIEPAPQRRRQMSWSTFLKAHWESFDGIDLGAVGASVLACLSWAMPCFTSWFGSHGEPSPSPQASGVSKVCLGDSLCAQQDQREIDINVPGTVFRRLNKQRNRPPLHWPSPIRVDSDDSVRRAA